MNEETTGPQGEPPSATGQTGLIALHPRICVGDVEAAEALAEVLRLPLRLPKSPFPPTNKTLNLHH